MKKSVIHTDQDLADACGVLQRWGYDLASFCLYELQGCPAGWLPQYRCNLIRIAVDDPRVEPATYVRARDWVGRFERDLIAGRFEAGGTEGDAGVCRPRNRLTDQEWIAQFERFSSGSRLPEHFIRAM